MSTNTPTKNETCQNCKNVFSYDPIMLKGKEMFTPKYCTDCAAEIISTNEGEAQMTEKRLKWEKLCPPLYRDTDVSRLPLAVNIVQTCLSWKNQPTGIGLVGASGAGKTRVMFKLLERLHDEGTHFMAISSKKFERWCAQMFEKDDDAKSKLKQCETTAVLFIDDIGKERITDRVESELYALIETRTAYKRPILWTSNATSESLKTMMSADRGTPIIRRLKEFSTIVSV